MVANKYAFLQITRRRFLNEWEAFKKVISRRNIRRRITIPLTLSNLKLLRRITRTENILHRNFTRRQVAIQNRVASNIGISQSTFRDRKSGSAGMPRPTSYAVFCLKKKIWRDALATAKELSLPRFDAERQVYVAGRVLEPRDDLRPGRFGIMEPKQGCPEVPLKQLDFTVVPGVAFSLDGRRLGRGRGFYDRLLALVGGVKCGIGFDEQIVDEIPAESHDIRLDCILTPTRWSPVVQGAVIK